MSTRTILQRHGVDLALAYFMVAAVLIDRGGLYPIGPWAPPGWFGYGFLRSTSANPSALTILAAWLTHLLPYFGMPLLLWLAALVSTPARPNSTRAWPLARVLLLCAAWIAFAARFGPELGLLWLAVGGSISMLSPTFFGWVLPFGPPLLMIAVWALRHRRGAASMAAA